LRHLLKSDGCVLHFLFEVGLLVAAITAAVVGARPEVPLHPVVTAQPQHLGIRFQEMCKTAALLPTPHDKESCTTSLCFQSLCGGVVARHLQFFTAAHGMLPSPHGHMVALSHA
jgi:hypothetical protein